MVFFQYSKTTQVKRKEGEEQEEEEIKDVSEGKLNPKDTRL